MRQANKLVLGLLVVVLLGTGVIWHIYGRTPQDKSGAINPRGTVPGLPTDSAITTEPSLVFGAMELPFRYERGESGAAWPVEPTGGGVAVIDFDCDGLPDLFFAQGVPLPVGKSSNAPSDVLLRNFGERRFEDVSSSAELRSKGYGCGVTVADYDSDGFPDVYVTRYGMNTLWHNEGDGLFRDVTEEAGVGCALWSLGAAFGDFDGDGTLDLFVANYFDFDPAEAPFARDPVTGAADYGAPATFVGQSDVLYRNDGNGQFRDITEEAGVFDQNRGMGVLAADFDEDGWMDILVANDAQSNSLWHNQGGGHFEDVALAWGVAVNGQGQSEANMGIAYGDTNDDALPDILISHLVNEHDTLWRARLSRSGRLFFRDDTFEAGLGIDSRKFTGWGTTFSDFDQDGRLDLIVVNGHIRREANQPYIYENPPILWRNNGTGRFVNVTATAGDYFRALHQARGLAAGDLDGDGDIDLVVVHHGAPSVVLWNETPHQGNFLLIKLTGRSVNRDAIGARVLATVGDRNLVRTVDGGGSYLSSNDPRIHLGLGQATQVDRLEIRWPSGRTESQSNVPANTMLHVREQNMATSAECVDNTSPR